MKLSTFGLWEGPRLDLVNDLFQDGTLKCTLEQINKALLEPVITKVIDTAFNHLQKLQKKEPPLSLKEMTLATYKEGLAAVLPSLAESLGKPEDLLRPYVEKFTTRALALSTQNIDYLMQLGSISIKVKTEEIAKLYGNNFSTEFPALAPGLLVNDSQLMEKAVQAVSDYIKNNCPAEILPMMSEHIKYMNEIAAQKMVSPQFAEDFKKSTGMTMEDYKAQVRLSKYTGVSSLNLMGHFKVRAQLKETAPEQPAVTLS